jgi:hypothetical protein
MNLDALRVEHIGDQMQIVLRDHSRLLPISRKYALAEGAAQVSNFKQLEAMA